jgi:hypothetical protein
MNGEVCSIPEPVKPPFALTLHHESLSFLGSSKRVHKLWRRNDVAAFCACCGAEITLKAEACPVCGTPLHGMLQPDRSPGFDFGVAPSLEEIKIDGTLRRPLSRGPAEGKDVASEGRRGCSPGQDEQSRS